MKYLPLALLLVAAPVSGQSLKLPTTVFLASAAVDWSSTAACEAHGCHETNPLINWIEPPGAMIAVGAAADVATLYVIHRFWGKRHPKLMRVGLYAVSALRVSIAARNFHTASRGVGPVTSSAPPVLPTQWCNGREIDC
jgi:hypothetical protein